MDKTTLLAEIERFPDDPNLAFDAFCTFLRNIDLEGTTPDFDAFAVAFITRFAARYQLNVAPKRQDEAPVDYLARLARIHKKKSEVAELESIIDNYDARSKKEVFGYAVLEKDEKDAILARLHEVKNTIVSSKLSERKKAALLRKIAILEQEVMSSRTPTERFFGFMIDLGFASGEMATKAKPAIDEFKDILRIIFRSRAKAEGLPLPTQWPQLPGPDEFSENR
jgi:hypothetical protein